MPSTIDVLKEQEAPTTPLFLFDCVLSSGSVERWATHAVTVGGNSYSARLLKHNLYQLRASSSDGLDGTAQISVTLANADSHFSEIERATGFKGAQVTITFVFFDLAAGVAASESRVVFRGVANPPDEITESSFRVAFNNRLSLQRIVLPEVQILRRCPWMFPANLAQRQEAATGGAKGKYSALYKCGYSPDVSGGAGNLDGSTPFTSCDFTRAACVARGMFDQDSSSNVTRRFGGLEFVPPQIIVRSFGEQGSHLSPVQDNLAVYSNYVPLVYGTAWYKPPIVFARNDGNLTRMEALLGMGTIDSAIKVIVNGIEIPLAQNGTDMTATGWYSVVTAGARNGAFDLNFTDGSGNPLGDPYGSMAMMSMVVPNAISNGSSLPSIQVLLNGLHLEQFDSTGASLGESFTNNPAWVLLDVLRRAGWLTSEIDLKSFAAAAAYCATAISTTDLNGNPVTTPTFQCNLVIQDRRSAAEVAVGIRKASALMLTYGIGGLLTLKVENTVALQQPSLPDGSNATEALGGGWPAYEFSDSSAAFGGLLRKANGDPAIRLWSQSTAATPNRLTVEFQDEFNEYQQDSLSLVDVDDALLTDRQVTAAYQSLGLPNFDQASRVLSLELNKAINGSTLIDFETTVKGVGLAPGDLITVTYLKEGLERQAFRIVRMSPGQNFQTVKITAQWHDDAWYTSAGVLGSGTRRQPGAGVGIPRPLVGSTLDVHGIEQFGITESTAESSDGSFTVTLGCAFVPPAAVTASSVGIPLLSLNAGVNSTGGTIHGGQTLYYAISAVDGGGGETALSFIVPATIPATTNTNQVTISGLSFQSGTASFNVYRGTNPQELLRIAGTVAVAASFTDSGATASLIGPPDENYDHATFYWRLELQPEASAGIFSATTIGNSGLGMSTNEFVGAVARITRGTGAAQERAVIANSATTITVSPKWAVTPDATSFFTVANATWNLGGLSATSPVTIEVPNRAGQTVEISGRSANTLNQESSEDLNPLTRWDVGGASGGGVDVDVAAQPTFGLELVGGGSVELEGIAFSDLTNTHTIAAGTLTLFYWNELASPTTFTLAGAIIATDTTITLSSAGTAAAGSRIQIESEVMTVTAVAGGGTSYTVARGTEGSTAAGHAAGALIYHLSEDVTIVPFIDDFFGSPASGVYSTAVYLPDVRIAAAEFFATNVRGNSPAGVASFAGTTDGGLRTLSGGQLSIQVEGYLAIQTNAAPPLVMEATHAVRDVFAVLSEAPAPPPGSTPGTNTLQLQVRVGSTVYCTLSFDDGSMVSNTVNGFGLAAIGSGAVVSLDVLSVNSAANSLPGRDLTVVVRL